jgi:hypothetical protein
MAGLWVVNGHGRAWARRAGPSSPRPSGLAKRRAAQGLTAPRARRAWLADRTGRHPQPRPSARRRCGASDAGVLRPATRSCSAIRRSETTPRLTPPRWGNKTGALPAHVHPARLPSEPVTELPHASRAPASQPKREPGVPHARLLCLVQLGRLVSGAKVPASVREEACQVGREDARILTNAVVSRRPRPCLSIVVRSGRADASRRSLQPPAAGASGRVINPGAETAAGSYGSVMTGRRACDLSGQRSGRYRDRRRSPEGRSGRHGDRARDRSCSRAPEQRPRGRSSRRPSRR